MIGYVSPDYFTHSVSYFIEAPLAHHEYAKYKVVVYSAVVKVVIFFISIISAVVFCPAFFKVAFDFSHFNMLRTLFFGFQVQLYHLF